MTRRVLKIVSRLLLGLVAVVVVAAVATAWRLSSGPIPVSFLTPYLEEALADIESGDTVKIGDTVVAWDSERSDIALVVRNLEAFQASGETRAHIERIKVSLTLRGLLRGRRGGQGDRDRRRTASAGPGGRRQFRLYGNRSASNA